MIWALLLSFLIEDISIGIFGTCILKREYSYSIVEKEDSQGYHFGYPESESCLDLAYPVIVGQSWGVGYQGLSIQNHRNN